VWVGVGGARRLDKAGEVLDEGNCIFLPCCPHAAPLSSQVHFPLLGTRHAGASLKAASLLLCVASGTGPFSGCSL
jgi:hypothetical protein